MVTFVLSYLDEIAWLAYYRFEKRLPWSQCFPSPAQGIFLTLAAGAILGAVVGVSLRQDRRWLFSIALFLARIVTFILLPPAQRIRE